MLEYGLSDRDESLALHMPVKKSGSIGHGLAHIERGAVANPTISESIPLRRLDDIASELNLSRVDFLKIDVEGWEMQALRGGAGTLARYKPVIMMEMVDTFLQRAGSSAAEILGFLRGLGYVTYRIEPNGDIARFDDTIHEACDVLCLHPDRNHI